jgi:Na+/H+-dicarboxylate symporter
VEVGRVGMVTGRAMQKYKNYFKPSDQIILMVLLCTLNITYQTIVEVGGVGMVTGIATQKYKNDVKPSDQIILLVLCTLLSKHHIPNGGFIVLITYSLSL